ncbi:hypothetical protein BJV74DRAFT_792345 [Russula compacta]|nr:hypothetical protein BJV74DRAFT_792345 [Russula compacta]
MNIAGHTATGTVGMGAVCVGRIATFRHTIESTWTWILGNGCDKGLRTAFAKEVACILCTGGSGGGYAMRTMWLQTIFTNRHVAVRGNSLVSTPVSPDGSCPSYPTTTSLGPSVASAGGEEIKQRSLRVAVSSIHPFLTQAQGLTVDARADPVMTVCLVGLIHGIGSRGSSPPEKFETGDALEGVEYGRVK